jgi:hypothetical protein
VDDAPVDAARLVTAALLVALVAALALLRARWRAAWRPPARASAALADPSAERTLVYFTSRGCSACRNTPALARAAAPHLPLRAVSVHERPDLAWALDVRETPTLFLVERGGRVLWASVGNPSVEELRRAASAQSGTSLAPTTVHVAGSNSA